MATAFISFAVVLLFDVFSLMVKELAVFSAVGAIKWFDLTIYTSMIFITLLTVT